MNKMQKNGFNFFLRYAQHKGWSAPQTKQALELMLRGPAFHWLNGLEPSQVATLDTLLDAFSKSFFKPAELRWVEAQEMFTKPQMSNESVTAYVIRLRNIAKHVHADNEVTRHALIAGLRPQIRMQVVLKGPKTFADVVEIARLAEASSAADPLSALLEEQLRIATKSADSQSATLKTLLDRVNNLTAAMQTNAAQDSFNMMDDNATDNNPHDTTPPAAHASNRQRKDTPQNRQRTNYSRNTTFQHQQQWNPNRQPGQWSNTQPPQAPPQTCPNCGYTHRGECPARGQQCRRCDRFGHFARCCRSSRRPPPPQRRI